MTALTVASVSVPLIGQHSFSFRASDWPALLFSPYQIESRGKDTGHVDAGRGTTADVLLGREIRTYEITTSSFPLFSHTELNNWFLLPSTCIALVSELPIGQLSSASETPP